MILQSDSGNAVGWLRKGRSSKPVPLRQCRRLAAVTLADQISVEARHVRTDRNMADQPSRSRTARPGPCVAASVADSDRRLLAALDASELVTLALESLSTGG